MATKKGKKSLFDGQETVKIRLPWYKGIETQVFVGVNGKTMVIKRGEEVVVPVCIAKQLEHMEKMQLEAEKYDSKKQEAAKAKELE